MAGKKRRYSDDDRATALAALAANNGCVDRTAKQLEIPESTLRRWMTGERHPEAMQMSERKKEPLANAFERIAYRSLESVTKEKLDEADVVDLLKTAGIAVDKMRLLRDEPTEITRHSLSDMSDDELDREITRLQEEAGRITGGKTAPGTEPSVATVSGTANASVPQSGG